MNEKIRSMFPIFQTEINDNKLVYFDNAATTQKPSCVINAVSDYYRKYNSNVHRGAHTLGNLSTRIWENSHKTVADFINAKSDEIIFVRNSTDGINLAANTYCRQKLRKGDVIATSEMEHHSNILPWRQIADDLGLKLEVIPVKDSYQLDFEYLNYLIRKYRDQLKLVSLSYLSNVLGVCTEVTKVCEKVHAVGGRVFVDAAQAVAHLPIDVEEIGCDFMTFSGHKIYGPMGIGVLYMKKDVSDDLRPFYSGGGTVTGVHDSCVDWAKLPDRFEAGTPNVAGAGGLAVALIWLNELQESLVAKSIDYSEKLNITIERVLNYGDSENKIVSSKTSSSDKKGWDELRKHERVLIGQLLNGFKSFDKLSVLGPYDSDLVTALVSFSIDGIHPHDIAGILDENGIAIRAGLHCAHPLHTRFESSGTARISFGIYNTSAEVNRVLEVFEDLMVRF